MAKPKTTQDNGYLFGGNRGLGDLKAVCNQDGKRLLVHTGKYRHQWTEWRIKEDIKEDFGYLLNEEEKIVTDENGNKLWIHTGIYYDQWTIRIEKDDIKVDDGHLYTDETGNN